MQLFYLWYFAGIVGDLISRIDKAVYDGEDGRVLAEKDPGYFVFQVRGFSGRYTRGFFNSLMDYKSARYLEVGTFCGSTLCASLFNNKLGHAAVIDNWSQFGCKDEFLSNAEKCIGENSLWVEEGDSFQANFTLHGWKFNTYFYDGLHQIEAQYAGISRFQYVLDDFYILIVDDWNWLEARKGTQDAMHDLGLQVVYEKEIRIDNYVNKVLYDHSFPPDINSWWNGLYVAVVMKTDLCPLEPADAYLASDPLGYSATIL